MTELVRACQVVAHKDSTPLRVALFRQLAAQRATVRAALAAWRVVRGTPAATTMLSALAASSYGQVRGSGTGGRLLGIEEYDNEARQLDMLQRLAPDVGLDRLRIDGRALLRPSSWADLPIPRRELGVAWSLIERYAAQGDFLVAGRVAMTVGYYLRLGPMLARHPARAVIVSSDANPCAVALMAAAREQGRKTCFVTHGHVAEGPPPLRVDLALVDGEAVRDVYARSGPIDAEVVYRGSEGSVREMSTARLGERVRTLGVFLSILVDWEQVARQLDALRATFEPEQVLLRLHPNTTMRDPHWSSRVDLSGVRVSTGDRVLTDDAAACDLVVIGNSSAHLSVLKFGVPTLYWPELDCLPRDYYRFAEQELVCPDAELATLRAFYGDPGWGPRFARFDAAYPDQQGACDAAVADALYRLAGLSSP